MYYAAINSYANATSVGFANTWGVLGFASRKMRDAYVKRATDMATCAITSKDVRKYGARLGQIDHYDATGRLRVIDGQGGFADGGESIDPTTAEIVSSWRFKAHNEH
jgi:hypothetical protein